MPKGFQRGCPLPENLKMLVLRDSGNRNIVNDANIETMPHRASGNVAVGSDLKNSRIPLFFCILSS